MNVQAKIIKVRFGDDFRVGDLVFIRRWVYNTDFTYYALKKEFTEPHLYHLAREDQIELLDKGARNLTAFQLHILTYKLPLNEN